MIRGVVQAAETAAVFAGGIVPPEIWEGSRVSKVPVNSTDFHEMPMSSAYMLNTSCPQAEKENISLFVSWLTSRMHTDLAKFVTLCCD